MATLSEQVGDFGISPKDLARINSDKDHEGWQHAGGTQGIAQKLHANLRDGLSSEEVPKHRAAFGPNKFKEAPPKSFFSILKETLKDPTLILLMFAATVSTVLGIAIKEEREENAWVEGVAIWVAVLLVSFVGSLNDYQKELQFRKLNAQKDAISVKVIRDGKEALVPNDEIVVGDLMVLDTGDKVVADGLYIEGHNLVIDEASLTGESDPIKKNDEKDFWCRSGTQVTDGDGKMLVIAVGPVSEWGMIMEKVTGGDNEETPLQEKLGFVAAAIGKIGFAVASCAFVILLIRWLVANKGFPISKINDNGPIQFFLYAITIIVVAVPEGLPLAVTISLAYSMKKMMKDNNFVRHLAACETMGGATAICSDKTGTLTENRMTVVEGWFAGKKYKAPPTRADLGALGDEIINNICLNSKAFYIEEPGKKIEFVGNRTECALLLLAERNLGVPYTEVRKQYEQQVVQMYGFSSAKKMASVLIDRGDGTLRLYNKGASEWVLDACVAVHEADGAAHALTPARKAELLDTVTEMAARGLRTLALTYTDLPKDDPGRSADFFAEPPDRNLVLMCIVGIKDPVRREVPGAVATCKRAGITVRMVTGDNIHTAQHIARECGILYDDGLAMEGPVFRNTPREEMMKLLPRLQVLARSSPTDKHTLVNMLKEAGEVVAVTGDGTNDAPALKESDVGLAMGIAGTEVAKEAADIVILDDNFKSIVLAVMWGRSVFNNIRKFLQFQLNINIVALVVAFIGAFVSKEPLNVLQLLWVNLIMDTLAALALATEDPHVSLLSHKPHGREAPLISGTMWKHLAVQSGYQITWMLLILFAAPEIFDRYRIRSKCEDLNYNLTVDRTEPYFCTTAPVLDMVRKQDDFNGREVCELVFQVDPSANVAGQSCPGVFDEPNDRKAAFCGDGVDSCNLLDDANEVWELWSKFYKHAVEDDEETSKSVLFNAFIFMQIFNEINSRKILDEYNVFEGILSSPIFVGVLVITTALQIIIVQTPVSNIFHVAPLNGTEWAISIAIGFGCLPLSILTRFITRAVFKHNVPRADADIVDMDIGYGGRVVHKKEGLEEVVPKGSSSDSDTPTPKK